MAVIGAIAPWFGGKRNLAPRIVAELRARARQLGAARRTWDAEMRRQDEQQRRQ